MFPSTRWTLLAQATMTGDAAGQEALSRLCENYRPPVVAFLNHKGVAPSEAEDWAQELFARLLTSRAWKRADPEKGKFRTFLLGILRNVMKSQHARDCAQKNGGGQAVLSLDALQDESAWEPSQEEEEPCFEFDRAWAVRTLRSAFDSVRDTWHRAGKERAFQTYSRFLPGSQLPASYEDAAAELGMEEGAVRTAVSRLRFELGEALRHQVALTVASSEAVDDELRYLHRILANRGVDL